MIYYQKIKLHSNNSSKKILMTGYYYPINIILFSSLYALIDHSICPPLDFLTTQIVFLVFLIVEFSVFPFISVLVFQLCLSFE